jgi:hypothetical protein
MSLAFSGDDVFAIGTDGMSVPVTIVRLPFSATAAYEHAVLAVAPQAIGSCTSLTMLEYPDQEGRIVLVAQAPNYLKKDGERGGNMQWPIVLSVREKDIGRWIVQKERVLGLDNNGDHDQAKDIDDEKDVRGGCRDGSVLQVFGK